MLTEIIDSSVGWFHFITAILAMVSGTIVLLNKKGTTFHKRVGYTYVQSMIFMNVSSFFIINFDGFSIFHFFAIISLLSIIGGMLPTIKKKNNWLAYHFYFMNWSVVGLYCAFWAEVGTRFVNNMKDFWWMVALATFVTAFIGSIIINKQAKKLNLK
ncbi:DUF2306 domain-containing protein [Psychroserpens sp.]|uniref:DUF2306 domain-containing protein n=1 Tax=Psychroserpens sp. TaxID=2020870 RepID=UPI001B08D6A2|nr:DUF2306 domain-containing protein [Psychroserpens sp.]MBO6606996.1 DUF2306 domain-containing protein [Psychroserpens sp.]MBO6630537.1 DUF2306 domain-containing protein [Psychroserpens sp.]MBO6654142.1 DUF2306 domain-containing protein [Psychroserpens sp.]MBO6682572.1 DUF2306 domain-containing protein [Psychroserpens sp.]MBO6750768.1 DUF2306 domain-containing protein [Psychroserpens sp.]